ncbi:3'-5' exonuclease [Gulosibacter chungangensis]|uniref:3'-5' exonuclease n=1 Tax=Gulosibacter chungangensis TaxID=979746 RepID=UPI001787C1EE|nr:3'-5' exonuclease [Gulosibacter chungangensis]
MKNQSSPVDGSLKTKIFNFLTKLSDSDETPGLHIEPIQNSVDPRARTGRIDQQFRAVLFRLESVGRETTYVFEGAYNHDEAIERAKTRKLQVNPVNGVPEIIELEAAEVDGHGDAVLAKAAEIAAAQEKAAAATARGLAVTPLLVSRGYTVDGLVTEVGFTVADAERLMAAADEAELSHIGEAFVNSWQQLAVVAMLEGIPQERILAEIEGPVEPEEGEVSAQEPLAEDTAAESAEVGAASKFAEALGDAKREASDEAEQIIRSFEHPAAKQQFRYIEDQDELQRVIESDDFGQWIVFLHPDQQRYVDRDYNGPFRLTGGAGTGKTVVLLHRARRLAKANPDARIVLTTFTRALARMLARDLKRLDAHLPLASKLGEPGIYIAGIDQLVAEVRRRWPKPFDAAALRVIGDTVGMRNPDTRSDDMWDRAVGLHGDELGPELGSRAFAEREYLNVVLRNRILERDEYLTASRAGIGQRLGRKQRVAMWKIIEQFRLSEKLDQRVAFYELAAIGAAMLEETGLKLVDHLLVDEGQDLTAPRWQFLRALAVEGPNDMFIAEDAHQRIYGQPVRMGALGINIRGRSRRLRLNYRTTQETLDFALKALAGETWETGEGTAEDNEGYVSARRGPEPRLLESDSGAPHSTLIAQVIGDWIAEGIDPRTIAVLGRTKDEVTAIARDLTRKGIPAKGETPDSVASASSVVTMTMHQSKGQEFSRVVLHNLSDGAFPRRARRGATEEELHEIRQMDAALLYVAATRARDELVVTYSGEPTGLLV